MAIVSSPPPLQPRNVSILHPHVVLEDRPPVSPLSEPQRRALGHLPPQPGLKPTCKEKGCKRTAMTSQVHSWMAASAR